MLSISDDLTEAPIDTRLDLMTFRERLSGLTRVPLVRQGLVVVGVLVMITSVLIGPLPGPGFIILFPVGLALVLQNSPWAKRLYVRFKRRHPNKGRWADWGMRRASAKRREELEKARQVAVEAEAQPFASD